MVDGYPTAPGSPDIGDDPNGDLQGYDGPVSPVGAGTVPDAAWAAVSARIGFMDGYFAMAVEAAAPALREELRAELQQALQGPGGEPLPWPDLIHAVRTAVAAVHGGLAAPRPVVRAVSPAAGHPTGQAGGAR